MNDDAKVLRGTIDSEKKYCRIPIRRRRATRDEAERFVRDSLQDLNEMLAEYADDEETVHQINHSIACMLYIDDLMHKPEPPEEGGLEHG